MRKFSLAIQMPLAAFMALLVGSATAFYFVAMPVTLIEQGVIASGIATLIASASPPLGVTGRAMLVGGAALIAGGLTWVGISLAGKVAPSRLRPRPEFVVEEGPPIYLRGNEYPQAPAWRPIFASEIGSPDEESPPVIELIDVATDKELEGDRILVEPLAIGELMARLEAGVERRAAMAVPAVQTPLATDGDDVGALRNALEELQRMAVR